MNKKILKDYAPKARTAFIQAITDKAALYGITENSVLPCEVRGDFAFISGRPFPRIVNTQRRELLNQINEHSFSYVMEEIAYTWFNRFAAIRFMEVNGYLSHGYRVLSHPEGHNIPEIVEKAQFITMAGLDKDEVIQLKMAGDKDDELYRGLLIAQCNELSSAMPFLFEKVDDPTELLLPDNLLHTGSIIRDMVETIPEADWREVEIIGWLYQFYISEKKDELMAAKKAYKSEDIPAVTQLFTPNWIVKYLLQNSLGAKWLRTYPASSLKSKMEYYIEPAEQTPEVDEELRRITPSSLNPEELTVMDPACGSGHILVEAYDLLKEIYLERGYRRRDIPRFILEKNLFGLEIDDRAAQLAGFAIMMKARRDDSGIFGRNVKPSILVIKSVTGEGAKLFGLEVFENANTFGSLISIPDSLKENLPVIQAGIDELEKKGDLLSYNVIEDLRHVVRQTELLSCKYDVVVANPPYMGSKGMNAELKKFATKHYSHTKSDLFAMFIERGFEMAKPDIGHNAMVTMQSWMFLSSLEKMRESMIYTATIRNMVHMSSGVMGIAFGTSATIWFNTRLLLYKGSFSYVDYSDLTPDNIPKEFPVKNDRLKDASSADFQKIPGLPIAYWVSLRLLKSFELPKLGKFARSGGRCKTHGDELFLRYLWEVNKNDIGVNSKWCQLYKGGDYRKYYGNRDILIKWSQEAKNHYQEYGGLTNPIFWEMEGITWTIVTSKDATAFRIKTDDAQYSSVSPTIFLNNKQSIESLLCLLNSVVADELFEVMNPTLALNVGNVLALPIPKAFLANTEVWKLGTTMIKTGRNDWDSRETSWDFSGFPVISYQLSLLEDSYNQYRKDCHEITAKMKELEEENNQLSIEAYGLEGEFTPDIRIDQVTLFANPKYRYKADLSDIELEARFKEDTMKEVISYSVGCMMGRYSLDEPGLIYAHSGNIGFDESKYRTFPADADGIIPITDAEWFDDDTAFRFFRFIEIAWAKEGLEDNLNFIADAIGTKASESSRDAIRRYFVSDFFKDHLKTYKKRPIYWLFSSGKQKAFQALVYLHRYNEGTLSRMRTEYVLPLQSRLSRYIENLEKDREAASSTSAANKIQKEIDKLRKQREELLRFDEKLRHYADMRIKLDLDDGVKVNYDKFGDLLAEVKAVTGGSE